MAIIWKKTTERKETPPFRREIYDADYGNGIQNFY